MDTTVYFIPNTLRIKLKEESIYLTHIGYYPKKMVFSQAIENNPDFVFLYCEEGSGLIGYNNKKYHLSSNEVFIFPAKSANYFEPTYNNPWSLYCLHFNGKDCENFLDITGKVLSAPDILIDILREMCHCTKNDFDFISYPLGYILFSLKRFVYHNQIDTNIIQQSIEYMKNMVEGKITLDEISDYVGYSSTRFNVLFKESVGYTPMEYYNQIKIQRACYYLQLFNYEIKEIAYMLGFYDPFHFSNAFKKEMGMSPKEFRKQYILKPGI